VPHSGKKLVIQVIDVERGRLGKWKCELGCQSDIRVIFVNLIVIKDASRDYCFYGWSNN
jgi:hypothetical protein